MSTLAQARIAMWEGGSLWLVDTLPDARRSRTEVHSHHAIQISFLIGGSMRFESAGRTAEGAVIAVAADAPHVFEARGKMAHLFVDPDGRKGRTIAREILCESALVAIPAERVRQFMRALGAELEATERGTDRIAELGQQIVDALVGSTVGDAPDLRVRKLIAAASERLHETISLSDFAGIGGLSTSRLRHLFVEQTGLPFRTFLLWLRLSRALEEMVAGESLTSAAHYAGFSDSAHFSRTFKRMFGLTPTALRMT